MKTRSHRITTVIVVLLACAALVTGCASNKQYYSYVEQLDGDNVKIAVSPDSSFEDYTKGILPSATIVHYDDVEDMRMK